MTLPGADVTGQRYRFNFRTTVHFHARVEESDFSARSYSSLVDVAHAG